MTPTATTTRTKRPVVRIPRADYPVERLQLANGLRVLLAPDKGAGVVGVAVHYDVGFRSEPEGRTGFAHLFEHLMFQGSESLPKLEHFRLVQSSGGVFNGSTHTDYTDYFEVVPGRCAGTRTVPGGRPDAGAAHHRREPDQSGGRGQRGNPAQRAEPALRRISLDPAAGHSFRLVRQRAQRIRRLRRSAGGHRCRLRRVLRDLLHAGQRGADGLRRLRRRGGHRADPPAFRRHSLPARRRSGRPSTSRGRRRSARSNTSTSTRRRRRWRSAGDCPTRSPTCPATWRSSCWPASCPTANRPGCSRRWSRKPVWRQISGPTRGCSAAPWTPGIPTSS